MPPKRAHRQFQQLRPKSSKTTLRTRKYLRGDYKRGVFSKLGGKDERRGTTHRGMGRRILRMPRSAGQMVQPGLPQWVGVGRRQTCADGGDRTPENVAVLGIQHAMSESESVTFNNANRRAFSVRVSPRAAEICDAMRSQASGVFKAQIAQIPIDPSCASCSEAAHGSHFVEIVAYSCC